MVPEVKGIYKGVHTPDYTINGERWDLKELKGIGKDCVRDAIKRKLEQAENFIIDITHSGLEYVDIEHQVEKIFGAPNTRKVKTIMIIEKSSILKIVSRK
ncbi:MAG: hypothetical protein ACI4GD_12610 [Lachnospiraceae bacterium]